jgi:hypothetical protein
MRGSFTRRSRAGFGSTPASAGIPVSKDTEAPPEARPQVRDDDLLDGLGVP